MSVEEVDALFEEGGSKRSHSVDKKLSLSLPHVLLSVEARLEGLRDAQIERLLIGAKLVLCELCAVDGLEILVSLEHEVRGDSGPLGLMDKIIEKLTILRLILNRYLDSFLSHLREFLLMLIVIGLQVLPYATLTSRTAGGTFCFSFSG